ncbi:hypothetical protein B0T20DRAFT_38090 [Sordaria brevicollis]|uniref:Uncharacterized protein n=1 Tax=Sordaria brevicollis TaxID=83679 RepID=A0AAE0P926_SORBR|nr:hypothetical protein B0T20DRAFT_38090 [Sordaria brevicollis]
MAPGDPSQSGVISGRVTKSVLQTPGKPKPSQSGNTGNTSGGRSGKTPKWKYGFCPECRFGHLVRKQINPDHFNQDIAGKYRLSCSHRERTGCQYYEIKNTDPMLTAPTPPSKKTMCPQCTMGRLVKKIMNPFNFKEQWMECDRSNATERPCDYRQDMNGKSLESVGAGPGKQPMGPPSDRPVDGRKLDKGKAPERPGTVNKANPKPRDPDPEAGPPRAAEAVIDLTEDGEFTPETTPSPVPPTCTISTATAVDAGDSPPISGEDTKPRVVETAADILSSQTVIDLVSGMSSQASDLAGPGEGSSKQAETLAKLRKPQAGRLDDAYLDEFDSSDDEELAHLTDYIYTSARKPTPRRSIKREASGSPIAKIERED